MARKSLDIVARVIDAASDKLKKIEDQLKNTGTGAAKAGQGFKEFNRLLFTTTAFIATFKRAFEGIGQVIEKGAEVGRVTDQFERVLGPKSRLFELIDQFTDNSIDRFAVMKSGIELGSLGIVRSIDQIASLTAKAGTAAKLAGKSSAEGIEEFTAFLKDGSITHLEFLNLIAKTNPALQAQLAVLKVAGGVMGTVLDTQMKLSLGTSLLTKATKDHLKGERDLLDVILDVKQAFFFLRSELGSFLGSAIAPITEKLKTFVFNLVSGLENIRKNDKLLRDFGKALIIAAGATTILVGALGALRLITLTLTSLGLGLPSLLVIIGGLTAGFMDFEKSVDKIVDRLRTFGLFFVGAFQLVRSFLSDPENFAKGIGKMDKSIYDLLQKKGLLELVKMVARAGSVIAVFVKDSIDGVKFLANWITTKFDLIGNKILQVIDKISKPWKRFWIEDQIPLQAKALRWIGIAAALFTAFKGLKFLSGLFGGVLSKLPIVGGLFGGKGPKGTEFDPMYVVLSGAKGGLGMLKGLMGLGKNDSLLGKAGTMLGVIGGGAAAYQASKIFNKQLDKITGYTGPELVDPMQYIMNPMAFGPESQKLKNMIAASHKGAPIGSKTGVVIPQSEDSNTVLDILKKQSESLNEDKKSTMSEAFGAASASYTEETGISAQEYYKAMVMALDSSRNLNKIAESKLSSHKDSTSRRSVGSFFGH